MPSIDIIGSGRLDERESAFPQAVQLPSGEVLCSFGVGGGATATGGTEFARSSDGGETWAIAGSILPPTTDPYSSNFLKLSLSPDGKTIYAYGSRSYRKPGQGFGEGRNEAVLCISTDDGHTWSAPTVVPMPADCPLEISHGILPLASGRLLAPAATLPSPDRLGEQVIVAISDDGGQSWPSYATVLEHPEQRFGYFEQKLAEISPGRVIATAWTVTLGDVVDQPNSFAISHDNGISWGSPRLTGIMGQTMTPIPLGGDRLLVLYNRRYGDQLIVMNLVTFTEEAWTIHNEGVLYDAKTERVRSEDVETGVEELDSFEFGFPTALQLQDGTFLATHWSKENGKVGIRWTKLRINW